MEARQMKGMLVAAAMCVMMAGTLALAGCGGQQAASSSATESSAAAAAESSAAAAAESSAAATESSAAAKSSYTVDYGTSEIYSQADIDSAIATVMDEFDAWEDVTMKSIAYAGDEACGEDELAYVNELREAQIPDQDTFDQAIVLTSDFHTDADAQAAWEPDSDYDGYTWHMGRTGNGEWLLMTWGYA